MGMDITGPFPTTAAGFKYILVLKCALTLWVEIFALINKSMEEVAECIVDEVICRHGAFDILLHDQGKEFDNRLLKQICLLLKIRKIRTSGYNPRSNGRTENHNRTLADQLAAYCNQHHDDWDIYLPVVAHAYRTTVSYRGYTPFYMLYGRECSAPSEAWIQEVSTNKGLHSYVDGLTNALQSVWSHVAAERPSQQAAFNKQHTPKLFKEYKVGDYCYIKYRPNRFFKHWSMEEKHKIKGKLAFRYCGPYLILHKFNPVVYKIAKDGQDKVVHAINMKPH